MIIAIDAYEAAVSLRVGVGRYSFEILRALYILVQSKPALQVRVYSPMEPTDSFPSETSQWQYFIRHPRRFWTFLGLPISLFTHQPPADVVFSPTHYIPRFTSIPKVMSIMDLSYLRYPELFKKKDLHQLVHWTAYSVRHAKRILTISEFSKRAIMEAYNVPSQRVIVTYPGFTMANSSKNDGMTIRSKYHLSSPFVLSVGTIQPRKNFTRLVEAFSLLIKNKKYKVDLVIVGKKGWLYEEILKAPDRLKIGNRVHFLDYVPDEDLPGLYKEAECFVLPSLYEGFGLPVLEAMAHECPVIISNNSSLPEIAAAAAIYIEPEKTESILAGIRQALDERNSKKEKERIATGVKRVKNFTWEKAAAQTLAVLEEVGKEK